MVDHKVALKEAKQLCKAGNIDAGLSLLQKVLQKEDIPFPGYEQIGRLLSQYGSKSVNNKIIRVFISGQCTTTWVCFYLTALAWRDGCLLEIVEADYDNVMQSLHQAIVNDDKYDAVILLPWQQNIIKQIQQTSVEQCISEQVAFWQSAWQVVHQLKSRLIQVGYDYCYPGPPGSFLDGQDGGNIDAIRRLNTLLRTNLPRQSYFVDLELVSGQAGRNKIYDQRRYFWTKQPFSEQGLLELTRHVWAGLRAMLFGSRKVLILDLDNTLWGGVVGELGPQGIALGESPDGEAYLAFQRYISGLHQQGILLAVASKNNFTDAIEPFTDNPFMELKREHFSAFKAGWGTKAAMLEEIAKELRLGLDSFVFFDDNPVEREHIRQMLPMVAVPEVPTEPAEYIPALIHGLWFESVGITDTDKKRNLQYQLEAERQSVQQQSRTLEDYLRSLDMQSTILPVDETSLQRVTQLVSKTNQFNTTTRRHSGEQIVEFTQTDNSITFCVLLKDKFGEYGIISVILAIPDHENSKQLRIDTWLMSCRAIGRTVEQSVFSYLLSAAKTQGFDGIIGEFIPTAKNTPVANLYSALGFVESENSGEAQEFYLNLTTAKSVASFVQLC